MKGIRTRDEANRFAASYVEVHNKKFACEPAESVDAHRPVASYSLDDIFCIHGTRKVQNDYTIRYKNRIIQLTTEERLTPGGAHIRILDTRGGQLRRFSRSVVPRLVFAV